MGKGPTHTSPAGGAHTAHQGCAVEPNRLSRWVTERAVTGFTSSLTSRCALLCSLAQKQVSASARYGRGKIATPETRTYQECDYGYDRATGWAMDSRAVIMHSQVITRVHSVLQRFLAGPKFG